MISQGSLVRQEALTVVNCKVDVDFTRKGKGIETVRASSDRSHSPT
jgi:hypothetical protein